MNENNITLLTEEALRKHDILTGATQLRQFACGPCNHPWWKFVPRTKPVSDCRKCTLRYDALERSKEFGIGRYICLDCDHTFYARCEAMEKHICFKCNKLVGPPFISPRFKPVVRRVPRSPFSKEYARHVLQVINPSTPHESTGSTVATFLTQDLGPDIPVQVHELYMQSLKDQTEPEYVSSSEESVRKKYDEGEESSDSDDDDEDDDQDSVTCEVGDLESELEDAVSEPGEVESDHESHEGTDSRRRSRESDSDSSEDEDKASVESSEPDSGFGTAGTGSDAGTGSTTDSVAGSVYI